MPSKKRGSTATKPLSSTSPPGTNTIDNQNNDLPSINVSDAAEKEGHEQEEEQEVAQDHRHGTDTVREIPLFYDYANPTSLNRHAAGMDHGPRNLENRSC